MSSGKALCQSRAGGTTQDSNQTPAGFAGSYLEGCDHHSMARASRTDRVMGSLFREVEIENGIE